MISKRQLILHYFLFIITLMVSILFIVSGLSKIFPDDQFLLSFNNDLEIHWFGKFIIGLVEFVAGILFAIPQIRVPAGFALLGVILVSFLVSDLNYSALSGRAITIPLFVLISLLVSIKFPFRSE